MGRYKWVVEEPRWSWALDGADREVKLERRRWSPGDVADGFYLYVASTETDDGLFGLRVCGTGDGVRAAKREALAVFMAYRDGRLGGQGTPTT